MTGGWRWVWLGPLVLAGCIYRTEPWAADLHPGDIAGTAMGTPPGTTSRQALPGARVRLKGSSVVQHSRANGKFHLRNLPEGLHTVIMSWAPPADAVPVLGGTVTASVRIGGGQRSSQDLGTVVLVEAGHISGRVEAPAGVDLTRVSVVLTQTDVRVHPDATGHFEIHGLGAGPWQVAAALDLLLSAPQDTTVAPGQVTTLASPLVLQTATGAGTLQGDVAVQPDPDAATASAVDTHLTLTALAGGPSPAPDTVQGAFARVVNSGLYVVQFDVDGFVPLRIPNVLVWRDASANLDRLLLMAQTPTGCVDLDGDGVCFSATWSTACAAACRQRGVQGVCDSVSPPVDCDDDGDGELDVDEAEGPVNPGPGQMAGPCRCSANASVPDLTPCANDPSRADQDFDGICDIYDAFPACALNIPDCQPVAPTDGGVPDAAPMDAGTLDASSVDASAPPDAAVQPVVTQLGTTLFLGPVPSAVTATPDGHTVLASVHEPTEPLQLGATCTTMGSTRAAYVAVLQGQTCLQAWEFPNASLMGMDVAEDGSIYVAVGQFGPVSAFADGTASPIADLLAMTGDNLVVLRLSLLTPLTEAHFVIPNGWVSGEPPHPSIRAVPGGDVVLWGNASQPVLLGTLTFTPTTPAGWVLRLDNALTTVLDTELWQAPDVIPTPQAVEVAADGTVVMAATVLGDVTIQRSPGVPEPAVPLGTGGTLVRTWPPHLASNATSVVLPFSGVTPPGRDHLLAVRQTALGIHLVALQDNNSTRAPASGVVYGDGGVSMDSVGQANVMQVFYQAGVPAREELLAVRPSVDNTADLVQAAYVDGLGRTYTLGSTRVGVSVLIPGRGRVPLLPTTPGGYASFVTRVDELGHASAVFAGSPDGNGAVSMRSFHVAPDGTVTVHGVFGNAVDFGSFPTCAGASTFTVRQNVGTRSAAFVWTIPPQAFDATCTEEPFSPAADPDLGYPSVTNAVMPRLAVNIQPGDIDCFLYTPPSAGHVNFSFKGPVCSSNVDGTLYASQGGSFQYPIAFGASLVGACQPLRTFLTDTEPVSLCIQGELGAPATLIDVAAAADPPPANDLCSAAQSVDLSPLGAAQPFLLVNGNTFNATPDPALSAACSLAGPSSDAFHVLTAGTAASNVALRYDATSPASAHAPGMVSFTTCPGATSSCTHAAAQFLLGQAVGSTLGVYGTPGVVGDQFGYQLLVVPSNAAIGTLTGAQDCASIGGGNLLDLGVTATGTRRMDFSAGSSAVDPVTMLTGDCGTASFVSGLEQFFTLRVPANITVTLVAYAESIQPGNVGLYLLDTCLVPGATCVAHENQPGGFDSVTYANTTGAQVDLTVLVDTDLVAAGMGSVVLAYTSH